MIRQWENVPKRKIAQDIVFCVGVLCWRPSPMMGPPLQRGLPPGPGLGTNYTQTPVFTEILYEVGEEKLKWLLPDSGRKQQEMTLLV